MYNHHLKFRFLVIGLFLVICPTVMLYSQNDDVRVTYHQAPNTSVDSSSSPSYKNDKILEKIAVGGTLGLQIGGGVYFSISPDISYHFNKWVAVGIGGTYTLNYDNYFKKAYHMFGARAFVEGHFFNYLGLHVGYEALNFEEYLSSQLIRDRIWANNLMLGGGYYQRFGRASTYFYVLYNLTDRPEYFYNLTFKAGFNIFLK